jgi:hypothetical protein
MKHSSHPSRGIPTELNGMHSNIDGGRNSFSNIGKDRHTLLLRHDLPERASKKEGTDYKLIFDADVHEDLDRPSKIRTEINIYQQF